MSLQIAAAKPFEIANVSTFSGQTNISTTSNPSPWVNLWNHLLECPVYPLEKNQLAVVFLDKHCGPHACSIQIWITRTPPQKKHHLLTHQLSINTSVFHQASLGHTGTLHRIPGSAVNCNKEWQRAPWPAEILLGTDGGVPLLVYEGFLAICQNSIHHSLLPWSSTKIFCYLLAYIYIENIYIYIYICWFIAMIDRKLPWSSSEGNLSRLVASNAVRFDQSPSWLEVQQDNDGHQ